MGMALAPTLSDCEPLAAPLATVVPATLMVAPVWLAVGVTVTPVTLLPTDAV